MSTNQKRFNSRYIQAKRAVQKQNDQPLVTLEELDKQCMTQLDYYCNMAGDSPDCAKTNECYCKDWEKERKPAQCWSKLKVLCPEGNNGLPCFIADPKNFFDMRHVSDLVKQHDALVATSPSTPPTVSSTPNPTHIAFVGEACTYQVYKDSTLCADWAKFSDKEKTMHGETYFRRIIADNVNGICSRDPQDAMCTKWLKLSDQQKLEQAEAMRLEYCGPEGPEGQPFLCQWNPLSGGSRNP